ncbi:hypothetical protein EOD39_9198 [Acipenser ruthenus]|uniref:Uncharacterized protein n=1 Tax=Acipenser ruthenus TaxID=7906 RepID=A0A662YWQ7_ACIRT|nr:hypothetical protein EOD39_9198 [Acipenser ruthenus]
MPGIPSKENDNDSRDSVNDTFNSSFSFIQISLNSSHEVETVGNDSKHLPAVGLEEPTILQDETDCGFSKMDKTDNFFSKVLWTDAASMSWQYNLIDESQPITDADMKQRMQDSDTFSVDSEAVFSFSVDSSNAASTGSSVTSGYESSTSTDHTWDAVLKKYDDFLQDCLQNEPVILPTGASSRKKRLHRRPGYMRGEQPKCLESTVEENSKRPCQRPGMSNKIYTDIQKYGLETCRMLNLKESIDLDHHTVQYSNPKAAADSVVNVPEFIQQSLTSSSCRNCDTSDASWKGPWPRECQTNQQNSKLLEWKRRSVKVEPALQEMPGIPSKENDNDSRDSVNDTFNSSFSFIQISLNSSHEVETVGNDSKHLPAVGLEEPTILQDETDCGFSKMDKTDNFFSKVLWTDAASMSWQYNLIDESQPITDADMKQRMQDSDTFSVDTEAVFSFSVDSSNAASTGSSVTSGYESSTSTDHTWDAVLKKYDDFLQDCLQSNRSNIKASTES